MNTKHNTSKSSRLQDAATHTHAKTTPNKNQTYSDIPATNSADSDTTNPIGDNDFSNATSTNFYAPLANEQNTPSPRPRKAPASRAM